MNTAAKVDQLMKDWRAEPVSNTVFIVRLANACIGWSYVFGARGEYCSPANRRKFFNSKGKETIKSKCKNFEGSGYSGCSGCKWYPGGCTRFYDCRGFTYWLFKQIGIVINGSGATSQWNDDNNWAIKGPISEMPKDKIACVFHQEGKTMEHTLFYDGAGYYIHCSGEVKKVKMESYKYATHYAIPKGLYDDIQPATPDPITPPSDTTVKLPTLSKGSKGSYVTVLQTLLLNRGYKLPKYGADGDFGNETLAAVKQFQRDWGLVEDGIVGPNTWKILESSPEKQKLYTVTIPHLERGVAEDLLKTHPGQMTLEQ